MTMLLKLTSNLVHSSLAAARRGLVLLGLGAFFMPLSCNIFSSGDGEVDCGDIKAGTKARVKIGAMISSYNYPYKKSESSDSQSCSTPVSSSSLLSQGNCWGPDLHFESGDEFTITFDSVYSVEDFTCPIWTGSSEGLITSRVSWGHSLQKTLESELEQVDWSAIATPEKECAGVRMADLRIRFDDVRGLGSPPYEGPLPVSLELITENSQTNCFATREATILVMEP